MEVGVKFGDSGGIDGDREDRAGLLCALIE